MSRRRVEVEPGLAYETCDPEPTDPRTKEALAEVARATIRKVREQQQLPSFKHAAFNPNPLSVGASPLLSICNIWEDQGWRLYQVIPHHQYESIAVFVYEGRDRDES